jgi:hypothetical protein
VGHSLGGRVRLAHAARATQDGRPAPGRLGLVATSCWRFDEGASLGRRMSISAYVGVARLRGHAPIRRLGMGTDDEPASYVRQLAGWARSGRFSGSDGFDFAAHFGLIRARALLVYGGGDPLCTAADTLRLERELGGRARSIEVSRARGFAFEPDHFGLVRDPRAAAAWDELAAFLTNGNRA